MSGVQEFTADFPPDMRGVAIGNADGIRLAHNSFAPPEAQLSDPESRKATDSDDVYHFVSYVHKAGALWELDGLQEGPIRCCDCSKVRSGLRALLAPLPLSAHTKPFF